MDRTDKILLVGMIISIILLLMFGMSYFKIGYTISANEYLDFIKMENCHLLLTEDLTNTTSYWNCMVR